MHNRLLINIYRLTNFLIYEAPASNRNNTSQTSWWCITAKCVHNPKFILFSQLLFLYYRQGTKTVKIQAWRKKKYMIKEEHYSLLYYNMLRNLASFSRISLDSYLAKYTQKFVFVRILCSCCYLLLC